MTRKNQAGSFDALFRAKRLAASRKSLFPMQERAEDEIGMSSVVVAPVSASSGRRRVIEIEQQHLMGILFGNRLGRRIERLYRIFGLGPGAAHS